MRYVIFLLMPILFSQSSFADPFYAQSETNSADEKNTALDPIIDPPTAENPAKPTACDPDPNKEKNRINIEFKQLKLIGILEINGQFQALFKDEENKIYDLKPNQILITLNNEMIEIKNISLKSVQYLHWQPELSCQPAQMTLKL